MSRYAYSRIIRAAAAILAAVILLPAGAFSEQAEDTAAPASVSAADTTVLRYGSKGDAVKQLQERLQELGYDPGTPDGIFGKGTRSAVMAFQRRNGLTADGEAGPTTLARLYSEDAVPVPEASDPVDVLGEDLPILVNRTHPVDETFLPADLVSLSDVLDKNLVIIKYEGTQAVREAAEALERMLEAAKADGVTRWQISAAYRTWSDQETMLNSKINSYLRKNKDWSRRKARSAALHTVAEPGCSEHHLGLAIDINVPGASSFQGTKQCRWLHAHCWEYGFIVRYQKDKEAITGFMAEAWHIRYVGVEHALKIRDLEMCLEEYLEGIEKGTVEPPAEIITDEIILPDDDRAEEGESVG